MSREIEPIITCSSRKEKTTFSALTEALKGMFLETRLNPETSSFARFDIEKEYGQVSRITIEVPRSEGRIARCFLSRSMALDGRGHVFLGFANEFKPEQLEKKGNIRDVDGVCVYGNYPLGIETIQSGLDSSMEKKAIFFVSEPLREGGFAVVSIDQDGVLNLR